MELNYLHYRRAQKSFTRETSLDDDVGRVGAE